MNQLQEEILKVLLTLDTICKEHDIEYGLYGGTFLGAVRHKGYIPWDDDVDIILSRQEFNRLDKVLKDPKNLPEGYYYQSIDNSKKYANSTPKLRSSSMDIYERMPKTQEKYYGPWVDIFIWDNVPDSLEEQKSFFKKIKRIDFVIFVTVFVQFNPNRKGFLNVLKGVVQRINELLHPLYFWVPILLKKRSTLIQSFNHVETKSSGVNCYNFYRDFEEYSHQIIVNDKLNEFSTYQFENHDFVSYKDYNSILTEFYGDYMTLPDEEDRTTHNIKY